MLYQQQQEQEVDEVGQEVVPPGVSTTLDKAEQVEPMCLVKRSILVVSFTKRNISVSSRCADGEVEAKQDPAIVNRRGVVAERLHQAVSVVTVASAVVAPTMCHK
jgi:hypothetical protein